MSDFEGIFLSDKNERFVKVPLEIFLGGRYLTVQAKWTYAALRSFTNNKTLLTFPGYDKLMERSGLSRNAVSKALAELEEFHWITKKKKFGKSNGYTFTFPRMKDPSNNQPIP